MHSWQLYSWWDEALAVAAALAVETGRRRRVRAWGAWWLVEEVDAA